MPLRIYLTGRVLVEDNGKILLDERRLMGRQGRLAFAHLVGEHLRAVPRDELAEELWPGAVPPSWERSLSALISKLRALLAGASIPNAALKSSFGRYQLFLPADAWIDVEAASEAIDRAESALRKGNPQDAWGWAQVAYQISRRSFLSGEEGSWATLKRSELREVLVRAHECLSEPSVWHAEPGYAVKHAKEALAIEPFRETSYQLLMRAHAAVGNRAEALRVYERCRNLLSEELGVPPSPQTEAVYLDILRS
ncbi:MAG TPA: BTAD domain-containing putative transcriptional regulator [Rubrobacter sp.]|nr:BTAD domain-containing putative transcriptional regulator [Rubrobacter sp.]